MKRLVGWPLFLVFLLVGAFLTGLPSGYFIISPGGSYEIAPILEIPEPQREEVGRLAFTAVLAGPGSWLDVIGAGLSRTSQVVPAEEVLPDGLSRRELNEINQRLIEESKRIATVVGLRAAGYEAVVSGQGAEVVGLLEGMPAAGVLRAGDVVVAVDGQPAGTAVELIELIRRHQVGEQVRLTIIRDGQQQEVVLGTKSSTTEPGRPVVGASIRTRLFDVRLPFPVEIETSAVGGPSAGLMFSLGVLDGVTDGVLTRGHFVAGTGTISLDGTVGPIGGAAQKVIAARRDGADVFLVPRQNYAEAQTTAEGITLVPIDRFEDAVRYLCGLEPTSGTPAAPPAPCQPL